MTKEQLINLLKTLAETAEDGHVMADEALLEYINDVDVTAAFQSIKRFYS